MKKKRKRHAPEQIVKKLRDADMMLNTGKSLEEVLKVLEVSEATLARWRRHIRPKPSLNRRINGRQRGLPLTQFQFMSNLPNRSDGGS